MSLPDGGKRVIKTCQEFLVVSKGKFDAGTEQDWSTLQAVGARCLALESLKGAKPAARSFFDWFTFSSRGIGKLSPGLSMLNSPDSVIDAKRAEKACRPWSKYDPTLKVKVETADKARVRTEGWTGQLILYARADFDGDGIEDLLLRRDAHVAYGGSATDTSVFIVTQTSAKLCPHRVRTLETPADGSGARAARRSLARLCLRWALA